MEQGVCLLSLDPAELSSREAEELQRIKWHRKQLMEDIQVCALMFTLTGAPTPTVLSTPSPPAHAVRQPSPALDSRRRGTVGAGISRVCSGFREGQEQAGRE
jgi:hypothetical protein